MIIENQVNLTTIDRFFESSRFLLNSISLFYGFNEYGGEVNIIVNFTVHNIRIIIAWNSVYIYIPMWMIHFFLFVSEQVYHWHVARKYKFLQLQFFPNIFLNDGRITGNTSSTEQLIVAFHSLFILSHFVDVRWTPVSKIIYLQLPKKTEPSSLPGLQTTKNFKKLPQD